MKDGFADYLREIRKSLDKGDATEHTHRPALKTLLESCGRDIDATNEPRRIACGAPDFNITRSYIKPQLFKEIFLLAVRLSL